mgnify:CR=1 FL=1
MKKVGKDTVDEIEQGKYGPHRDDDGCQDDESLKEVLGYRAELERPGHVGDLRSKGKDTALPAPEPSAHDLSG